MKTRLEYLKSTNNKLTYLNSMSFTATEFVWVPPVKSTVTLNFMEHGKNKVQEFTVSRIMTEYEKYPGEEPTCTICVVMKQIGIDPMGDDE